MSVAAEMLFVRNTRAVSRKIEGETLVVPIRGGVGDLDSIYSFNPLGGEIWALLEHETSVEEIIRWVADQYDVAAHQARSDIQDFLNELLAAGLIAPAITDSAVCFTRNIWGSVRPLRFPSR